MKSLQRTHLGRLRVMLCFIPCTRITVFEYAKLSMDLTICTRVNCGSTVLARH